MGLDAHIYYRVIPGLDADPHLPASYEITRLKTDEDYYPPEATHEVGFLGRYYGEDYERGNWPSYAGVLIALLADPCIDRVWYGHDGSVHWEVKLQHVFDMTEFFCRHPKSKPPEPERTKSIGMTDVNGQEICEGDIVTYWACFGTDEPVGPLEVIYDNKRAAFCLRSMETCPEPSMFLVSDLVEKDADLVMEIQK